MRILVLFLCAAGGSACGFAEKSGLKINVHLTRQGKTYTVLPGAVSTVNNAFVHPDLQQPIPNLSGNDKSLIENLRDFADSRSEAAVQRAHARRCCQRP